ncbi:MAG: class I SAM-dependent methyltransferase [Arenicellales bacterium]
MNKNYFSVPSRLYKLISKRGFYSIFIRLAKVLSRKGIYEFLSAEYSNITEGSKVLSIGAGGEINSILMEHRTDNGFDVITIDIDENRNPDIVGDVCTCDFGDMLFDVIIMGEVLEHLHSPHLAIDNIASALKPGGKLVITVPFMFPIHERPHDYYRYTRYGLQYILKEFDSVQIKERNGWAEAINVLFVRLVMEKSTSARIAAPVFLLVAFINVPIMLLLSKLIKTDFITSGYLISARKPG